MPPSLPIPQDIVKSVATLQHKGHQAYVVGGGVRDGLLGRKTADWDLCTSAHPEQVMKAFPKVIPTGLQHGTVTVVLRPGRHVEITTLRLESGYADARHPDRVIFTEDLNLDLARRDFTINAMAFDPIAEQLFDPFNGQRDLIAKRIQTVGDPIQRFQEDGLRPLRAIRFAAQLQFGIETKTLEAIEKTKSYVARVAVERVREELMKMLGAPKPSTGFEYMRNTGLMELFLPELLEGVGMEQNDFHAFDVYEHSLKACDAGDPKRPLLRLSLLLHDIGKPRTRFEKDGTYKFYGHDRLGAKMVGTMMKRLKFSNADIEYVTHLVRHHMFYYQDHWGDGAVRRFLRRIGQDRIQDLFALRIADEKASGVNAPDYDRLDKLSRHIETIQSQAMAFSTRDLAIDGKDVMNQLHLEPGPEVGEILEILLEKVTEDPTLNEREKLLKELQSISIKN